MVSISTYKANNHVHPCTQSIKTKTTTYHSAAPMAWERDNNVPGSIMPIRSKPSLPFQTTHPPKSCHNMKLDVFMSFQMLTWFSIWLLNFIEKSQPHFIFAIGWNFLLIEKWWLQLIHINNLFSFFQYLVRARINKSVMIHYVICQFVSDFR